MFNLCCVVGCDSRRKDVNLFCFPKDEKRLEVWLQFIKCETLRSLSVEELRKRFVCAKHFEKRFFASTALRARLRVNAFPTLFSQSEICSGIPQTIIRTETGHMRSINLEHNYFKRRHEDHTYANMSKRAKTSSETVSSWNGTIYHDAMEPFFEAAVPSTSSYEIVPAIEPIVIETVTSSDAVEPFFEAAVPSTSSCETVPTIEPIVTDISISTQLKRKAFVKKKRILSSGISKEFLKSKKQLQYIKRARRAIRFLKQRNFEKMVGKMNPLAKRIMWMQIKQCSKKAKGRRFTNEEKIIALSILKQSPKCYKYLQKIFILPSKYTLNKMISTINIEAGVNPQVFDAIKKEVHRWDERKKFCSIIFDEVALDAALTYERKKDNINGFVELKEKTNDFADHALVFMLRGSIHKWQQPVAYYFCKGSTSKIYLKTIIKEVVTAVSDTGLLPVALVCDQGAAFQSTLKSLQEDTRREQIKLGKEIDDVIIINGQTLSVIYDPPHLIKGLRNNFLTKNIKFEGKISTWDDIVQVYKTDCNHAETRLLHKLNDEHVIPEKIKKMKVKNCVRVFSKTVAATLFYTAQFSRYTDGTMVSPTLKNTAEIVAFFDDIFDAVNGSKLQNKGKRLRTAVTSSSEHHEFWKEALKKLINIKFVDKGGKEKYVPSLRNWMVTIKSYQRLWQFFKGKGINIMRPRYFNSDPIENFFGQVRAYNFRNNNPNCHSFKSTFKSLLITRFINFHSESYNCEEDSGEQLLNLKTLFEENINIPANVDSSESSKLQSGILESIPTVIRERLNIHSRAYTTGWVVRKVLNNNKCTQCKRNLTTQENLNINNWISIREYKNIKDRKLTYPSEHAVRCFGNIIQEANEYLETQAHKKNVIKEIKHTLKAKYSFDFLDCQIHRDIVLDCFLGISLRLVVFNWCNSINKILKGTDVIRLENRTLPPMQEKALVKYKTKLKNKTK